MAPGLNAIDAPRQILPVSKQMFMAIVNRCTMFHVSLLAIRSRSPRNALTVLLAINFRVDAIFGVGVVSRVGENFLLSFSIRRGRTGASQN